MRFLAAPVLVLWCAVAFAQDAPAIVVVSPKETVAGKQVKLDASKSTVDTLQWRLVDGPQDDFYVDTDGRHATFGTPTPGVYFIAIAGSTLVDDKPVATIAIVKVVLIPDPTKPADPPSTPPGTPPTTPPTIPPTTPPVTPAPTGLAAWVKATAEAKVEYDSSRARTAKAIAASYRIWASGIGSQINDPQKFVEGHNKLLDMLLAQANRPASWKPFRDALERELANRGLTTMQDHIAAWNEIAAGLEAVK